MSPWQGKVASGGDRRPGVEFNVRLPQCCRIWLWECKKAPLFLRPGTGQPVGGSSAEGSSRMAVPGARLWQGPGRDDGGGFCQGGAPTGTVSAACKGCGARAGARPADRTGTEPGTEDTGQRNGSSRAHGRRWPSTGGTPPLRGVSERSPCLCQSVNRWSGWFMDRHRQ